MKKGSADYEITDAAKPYVEAYQDFSRRLRTWLLAYGIGAPMLFVSQDTFSQMLKETAVSKLIILVFLAGVSIQVAAAIIYKSSMWYVFRGLVDKSF